MFFPVQFVKEHRTIFCAEIINFSGNALLIAAGNVLVGQVTECALRALGFGETAILINKGAHKLIQGLAISLAASGALMYMVYHSPDGTIEIAHREKESSL